MHTGVRMIHEISQKMLNGKPHTMGWMRSQAETEKHMAANGMKLRNSAPADGLVTDRIS